MTLKQISFTELMKHRLFSLVLFTILAIFVAVVYSTQTTFATSKDNNNCNVDTAIIAKCPDVGTGDDGNAILGLLVIVLRIMTAGVGIVAVGGIIYGGVLYASSGSSPDGVKKAIEVIRNVVIGLLAYLLMFGLLNFLIPGGIFGA